MKHQNAVKWLICVANKIHNRFESAQLLWEAMDGGRPYRWSRIRNHFLVFRDAQKPKPLKWFR